MQDVIQLLPDAIANQIAAGEVIQRPASVVKELLENAVDAGAQSLQLILKDGGKTLIQVIDNGCGMSPTDARMSLERHATSKLQSADDLFGLRTKGFRGEALASIAAVAQLELKTRRQTDELGTHLIVEGSEVLSQEPCQCSVGTSMSVKRLFFNVPARRQFLKSDAAEYKHLREEFVRIALAHPELSFTLFNNDKQELQLPATKLRRRVLSLFPKKLESLLVPIEEDTDVLGIKGFVGKPGAAKKSRGEQYFFVNDRFIKSSYLHHAVRSAYDELLPEKAHPIYFIFLEIDPARIDINVHPTKQEIKFEDERLIYNYLKATIRHGLARASVTPTLDFESDNVFKPAKVGYLRSMGNDLDPSQPLASKINESSSSVSSGSSQRETPPSESRRQANNQRHWERMYEVLGQETEEDPQPQDSVFELGSAADGEEGEIIPSRFSEESEDTPSPTTREDKPPYQLHRRYIVSPLKSGLLLIDQRAAHQRILYEDFLRQLRTEQNPSQQNLFPQTIELSVADAGLLEELIPELRSLGFEIEAFGGQSYIIRGVPADLAGKANEVELVQQVLDAYRTEVDTQLDTHERMARSLARAAAVKHGQILERSEMDDLIARLFACEQHQLSPSGRRRCYITFELDELEDRFGK